MSYLERDYNFMPELSEDISKLAALLMVAQLLDFFFTSLGMSIFGVSSEGNHFMRNFMHSFGPIPALVIAKSTAILLVLFLALQAEKIKFIKNFFAFALGVYFFTALLPWSSIIGNYLASQIA